MKKSRKYLLGTLISIYAGIFIFVGINRATESRDSLPGNEIARTPQLELDSFSGFNTIDARGDFILSVSQGETYGIEYIPVDENRGSLSGSQKDQTLTLEGFGNMGNIGRGRVNITLPLLTHLSTQFSPEVSVNGFRQDSLRIDVRNNRSLVIEGNTVATLVLNGNFLEDITFTDNEIASEQISINGRTVINRQ